LKKEFLTSIIQLLNANNNDMINLQIPIYNTNCSNNDNDYDINSNNNNNINNDGSDDDINSNNTNNNNTENTSNINNNNCNNNINTYNIPYEDLLLLEEIHKDAIRTYPELHFFQDNNGHHQMKLLYILFLYGKLNIGVKYVQV
jgi:hypothetical protein